MPPEESRKERRRLRRSHAEDDNHEGTYNDREKEIRRARGELACAECSRLKLKCDKTVPCSSCVRRGRASLCPNGVTGSVQEISNSPLNVTHFKHKIGKMSDRIRQLEDALEILQRERSEHTHPLLDRNLMSIKHLGDIDTIEAIDSSDRNLSIDDLDDAFGTLTISQNGVSHFVGRSGGTESLLLAMPAHDVVPPTLPALQDVILQLSAAWPLSRAEPSPENVLPVIYLYVPSIERASSLIETYLEHCSWMYSVVKRDQLTNELLPRLRECLASSFALRYEEMTLGFDDLSLLFMVFSFGAWADLTLPPYNEQAEQYFQLSKAIATLGAFIRNPSLAAVQAIYLMGSYMSLSSRKNSIEPAMSLINLASSLARSMGLHRDPARWKLDNEVAERRRSVFWEIFTAESLFSVPFGRSISFSLKHVDCKFPFDSEARTDSNGVLQPGYSHWRYRYSRDILYPLIDMMSSVVQCKYSEVLELDRKTRITLEAPKHLKVVTLESFTGLESPSYLLERLTADVLRDTSLMQLHRNYFAKALLEHPTDPLKSPYAHSYKTSYESAMRLLKILREYHEDFKLGQLMARFWILWSHMLTASLILGSIAARSPNSDLAPSALVELSMSIRIFEKNISECDRPRRALPILLKLRDRAFQMYSMARGNMTMTATEESSGGTIKNDNYDELLVFGGKTRLVTVSAVSGQEPKANSFLSTENTSFRSSTAFSSTAESYTSGRNTHLPIPSCDTSSSNVFESPNISSDSGMSVIPEMTTEGWYLQNVDFGFFNTSYDLPHQSLHDSPSSNPLSPSAADRFMLNGGISPSVTPSLDSSWLLLMQQSTSLQEQI